MYQLLHLLALAPLAIGSALTNPLTKRRDCTIYTFDVETIRIGAFCTSAVDDKRLAKRQGDYPGVGFGCLPGVWLSNSDHRVFGGCDKGSDDVKDMTGGQSSFVDTWDPSYSCQPASTNLDSIQLNGGTADVLNIVYHFNDGTSYNQQCTPDLEDLCPQDTEIGTKVPNVYYTCPPVNQVIQGNGFEDLCGDVIQTGCEPQ